MLVVDPNPVFPRYDPLEGDPFEEAGRYLGLKWRTQLEEK